MQYQYLNIFKTLYLTTSISTQHHMILEYNEISLLQCPLNLNFVKSEAMFAFSSYEVWNATGMPLHIRESDSVSIFKSRLKTHFFTLAFDV